MTPTKTLWSPSYILNVWSLKYLKKLFALWLNPIFILISLWLYILVFYQVFHCCQIHFQNHFHHKNIFLLELLLFSSFVWNILHIFTFPYSGSNFSWTSTGLLTNTLITNDLEMLRLNQDWKKYCAIST